MSAYLASFAQQGSTINEWIYNRNEAENFNQQFKQIYWKFFVIYIFKFTFLVRVFAEVAKI